MSQSDGVAQIDDVVIPARQPLVEDLEEKVPCGRSGFLEIIKQDDRKGMLAYMIYEDRSMPVGPPRSRSSPSYV